MTKITAELHNRLNAKFQEMKARDPELSAKALVRGRLPDGSPEEALGADLHALSELASSFATGFSVRAAVRKRAMRLLGEG
jgi:hypothetical protein